MMSDYFVAKSLLNNVLEQAKMQGLATLPLLEQAGFEAQRDNLANDYVKVVLLCRVYDQIAKQLGHQHFGLQLANHKVGEYSIAGYIVLQSATLQDAITHASRYYQLISNCSELSLIVENNQAKIVTQYHDIGHAIPNAMIDGGLASGYLMLKNALPDNPTSQLQAVHFQYEQPADTSVHQAFFQCPLYFNQKHNALVFDTGLLQQTMPSRDLNLQKHLLQHANSLFEKVPQQNDFISQFNHQLNIALPEGRANINHIAASLNISAKTLQRRLKTHGIQFRSVLDNRRKMLAIQYLDRSIGLIEIAFLLGYSEQSAFSRAFKGWFGCAPAQYKH